MRKFADKSIMVDTVLELAKEAKLNEKQTNKILMLVESLEKATETQKERFIMYYGLDGKKHRKLIEIAKLYNCTTSAIRFSIISVRNKLVRSGEKFKIIEEVVEEI